MTLTEPLSALHFGEIQTFDDVVDNERYVLDQRAYVVNLTRTIAFRAEADALSQAQHGGHLMVMMGGVAHVDGVEFQRFGQMGRLGRYPFLWHLMGDVDGQYIRRSAIHDSYNRCVVVHSTKRARHRQRLLQPLRARLLLGRGNEEQNVLSGNIGILSKRVPADRALLATEFNVGPGDRFPGPRRTGSRTPTTTSTATWRWGLKGAVWMAFRRELVCSQAGCEPPSNGQTQTCSADSAPFGLTTTRRSPA